jgi:hypothetical protein
MELIWKHSFWEHHDTTVGCGVCGVNIPYSVCQAVETKKKKRTGYVPSQLLLDFAPSMGMRRISPTPYPQRGEKENFKSPEFIWRFVSRSTCRKTQTQPRRQKLHRGDGQTCGTPGTILWWCLAVADKTGSGHLRSVASSLAAPELLERKTA